MTILDYPAGPYRRATRDSLRAPAILTFAPNVTDCRSRSSTSAECRRSSAVNSFRERLSRRSSIAERSRRATPRCGSMRLSSRAPRAFARTESGCRSTRRRSPGSSYDPVDDVRLARILFPGERTRATSHPRFSLESNDASMVVGFAVSIFVPLRSRILPSPHPFFRAHMHGLRTLASSQPLDSRSSQRFLRFDASYRPISAKLAT